MTALTYADIRAALPRAASLRLAAVDLNGIPRGKRKPVEGDGDVAGQFPYSGLNVDLLGHDIDGSPLVFATGDADGMLHPTGRLWPMPWLAHPAALVPVWMSDMAGTPFDGDPRHALDRAAGQLRDLGLTSVIGLEYEFYLVDPTARPLRPATAPGQMPRDFAGDVLCLRQLDAFDAVLSEIYETCAAMEIPAGIASSESGPGQYEITLGHVDDALRAADNAWGFKQAVKGVARKHGMLASFMAKPFAHASGSGFHAHVSLLDDTGRNVFDDGGPMGTPALRHAIRGCLDHMAASTLILAPHANSYARFVRDAHAPYGLAWGYDNRTVALRVPGGSHKARRLEHRVAGADANPYLVLATVLGAMADGLRAAQDAPPPLTGNAYDQPLKEIPRDWAGACAALQASAAMRDILPPALIDNLLRTKAQERRDILALSEADQLEAHLECV